MLRIDDVTLPSEVGMKYKTKLKNIFVNCPYWLKGFNLADRKTRVYNLISIFLHPHQYSLLNERFY